MKITKHDVINHAEIVLQVIQTIVAVSDWRVLRSADVIAAGVRAAIGGLANVLDGDDAKGIYIDARLKAIRDDVEAIDARNNAALAARFGSETD